MRIDKTEISSRLIKLKHAIPAKNNLASYVQGVLIKGNTATANNYDIGIVAMLSVEAETPFVLPLKAIEMIDRLPDDEVEIVPISGNRIRIKTGSIDSTFTGLEPNEFNEPTAPDDNEQHLKIEGATLHKIISSVMYAVSTNDTRPVYTGVLLDAKDGYLNVVATDGYRMAWNKTGFDGEYKFVIPKTSLDKLLRLGITGDINISLGKGAAVFASEEYTVYTRLLSGDFIDYMTHMTCTHARQIVVGRRDLLESVNRILICGDEKVKLQLVMNFADGKLILSTTSSTIDYSEEIEVQGNVGKDMRIGFNANYLYDAVKAYDSDYLTLSFAAELKPMIIAADGFTSLLLPTRL